MIDTQITEEMISVYVGWNKLEEPKGIDIIDFYLIQPRKGEEFTSREQVLKRLRELHESIKPTNSQEKFIRAKLNASIYYIRALMGEDIPFCEYVENITGVRPQLIPESVIARQKEVMNEHLRAVGYRPNAESFEKFYERIRIKKEEAMKQVKVCQENLIPIVLKTLGFDDLKLLYDIQFVEVDDYWGAWTSTKPDGSFLLRYNFHPDIKWRRGDIERITLHEVGGHFVQGSNLIKGISAGELNPFVGVTTVQDPHTFDGEGTANAILDLPEVEQALSPFSLLSRERVMLEHYLQNNAIIWTNEGKSAEGIVEYFSDFLFLSKDRLLKSVDRWKNDPSRKAYEYVYGISGYTHRQLLGRLNPEKRKEYLRYAMTRYETPNDLIDFMNRLFTK